MGMFDELTCRYPLPDKANQLEFQTKDTPAQSIDEYQIREDGSLWHKTYDTEDRSDPNAEGLMRLFGMATRVNESMEPVYLTGEIVFYAEGYEFSAYFVRGLLKHLETLSKPSLERKTNEGEE